MVDPLYCQSLAGYHLGSATIAEMGLLADQSDFKGPRLSQSRLRPVAAKGAVTAPAGHFRWHSCEVPIDDSVPHRRRSWGRWMRRLVHPVSPQH